MFNALICLIPTTITSLSGATRSLLKPGVVSLKERLESNAHVLIFILLTELVTEVLDAQFFELFIELFLLALTHAQHVVSVDLLGLLPEVACFFQNVSPDEVDCLAVLHHQVALVVLLVARTQHYDFT